MLQSFLYCTHTLVNNAGRQPCSVCVCVLHGRQTLWSFLLLLKAAWFE